jgi:hypothetical protein
MAKENYSPRGEQANPPAFSRWNGAEISGGVTMKLFGAPALSRGSRLAESAPICA